MAPNWQRRQIMKAVFKAHVPCPRLVLTVLMTRLYLHSACIRGKLLLYFFITQSYIVRWHTQVKDTLGAIAARFKALHIGGGGLFVGRLVGSHARPLTLKSVVRYSPNWVKNQNRMASTSNQETYRTDVDGRLVFDVLRQVCSSSASACSHATAILQVPSCYCYIAC